MIMNRFEKGEKAVEAVRKHYNCNGKYLCPNFHDYWFGDGVNMSYNCNECGADDFYAGYMQCVFDKENEL